MLGNIFIIGCHSAITKSCLLVYCILHRLNTVVGMGNVVIGLCLGDHIHIVDNSHIIQTLI